MNIIKNKEIQMLPALILLGILAITGAVWFALKMKKSLKFDNLIKDITEPVDVTPKTTVDVMKDISVSEKALQETAKADEAEAKRLQKDSAKVGDYLADRNVVKPKKGKEKKAEKE
jgi:hypothetical protein